MIRPCPPHLFRMVPWRLCLCLCLGLCGFQPRQLLAGEFERVRGAKLSVELVVGEARAEISAGGFYESKNATGSTREFFATQFRSVVSGSAKATHRLVSLGDDGDESWLESVAVAGEFDQVAEMTVNPDEISAGAPAGVSDVEARLAADERLRRALEISPVRLRILTEGGAPPRCEIEIGPAIEVSRPGVLLTHHAASKITETTIQRSLREGALASTPAPPRTREIVLRPQLRIGVPGNLPTLTHSRQTPPALEFFDARTRPVEVLSRNRIVISGAASAISHPREDPQVSGGFGDTVVRVSWEFTAGEPLDVGWLENAASDAETWLPEAGAERHFTVRLKDTSKVEAVRFALEEVSQYPGIAINAGEAAANSIRRQVTFVPVKVTAGSIGWTRFYQTYQPTAADSLPDLFFDLGRNPGFHLQGTIYGSGLAGPAADQLMTADLSKKVTATVSVNDFAASGVIRAQVRVDGVWEDLPARGPGLGADKMSLRFPVDADQNGVADAFETGEVDDDGDGIPLFEEYRGAYVEGKHVRLEPARFDAFIFDYSQKADGALRRALRDRLGEEAIALHWIESGEHSAELVGSAKLIVLEDLHENAVPTLLGVGRKPDAWRALAPSPEFRTVLLNGALDQQLLAADLKRILDRKPD